MLSLVVILFCAVSAAAQQPKQNQPANYGYGSMDCVNPDRNRIPRHYLQDVCEQDNSRRRIAGRQIDEITSRAVMPIGSECRGSLNAALA